MWNYITSSIAVGDVHTKHIVELGWHHISAELFVFYYLLAGDLVVWRVMDEFFYVNIFLLQLKCINTKMHLCVYKLLLYICGLPIFTE